MRARARTRGFSLLELLVAFAIMGISLAMLYRVTGSSARSVGDAAQYQQALVLAESLHGLRESVPAEGWNEQGQSGGFRWQVRSALHPTQVGRGNPTAAVLHDVVFLVTWSDGDRPRQVEVATLLPQHTQTGVPGGAALNRMRGFTLVEMLVAVALLSLVMLGLGSVLHTMGQAEQKIDERLARADEMRMAANFMRTSMARVSLRRVHQPPPARPSVLIGAGPEFVAWVGMMPARYGAGGRHFFRIGVEPLEQGSGLVVRFVPWADLPGFPDFSKAESRVLVHDVRRVQMRFLDNEATPAPAWLEGWVAADRAPDRVMIELETAHGTWPTLYLPMRGTPQSDPNAGRAAWGPS